MTTNSPRQERFASGDSSFGPFPNRKVGIAQQQPIAVCGRCSALDRQRSRGLPCAVLTVCHSMRVNNAGLGSRSAREPAAMQSMFANLTAIRSRREMRIKVALATLVIVAVTDGVDALVNLYTQPDRIWPSFIQTTLIAAAMSLFFLGLLARSNLRLFELKERFETLALTDMQTGLLNRRGFFASLDRVKASGADMTLGVVDIDHFKRINDTYGHLVGDYVIAEVGRSLREGMGAPHFVGRVGGEEFALALNGMSLGEAAEAADRLRMRLQDIGGPRLPPGFKVTASVGLARIGEDEVMSGYARADKALYEAKRRGRNLTISAELDLGSNVVPLPIATANGRDTN
ncbi:GGDEF domain-containing protein [Aureimonas phyllosphaerae]|uniref:GGDEF domain-containing protein n=1 Tax=Aureimonas phyllosphaerae TaxID=1166078 RepID=UPI003A5C4C0D